MPSTRVEGVVEVESGTNAIRDAHQRLAGQPLDSPFVPLDDRTGDLGVVEVEDVKDVAGGGVANGPARALVVLGWTAIHTTIGPNVSSPSSSATVEKRAVFCIQRRVLEIASLHRLPDLRSDSRIPHLIESRIEDTVGSLSGDFEGAVSKLRNREVVGLVIRAPQEFGRAAEMPWYQKFISISN